MIVKVKLRGREGRERDNVAKGLKGRLYCTRTMGGRTANHGHYRGKVATGKEQDG